MLLRDVTFIQILTSIINQVATRTCGNCGIVSLHSHSFIMNTFTWYMNTSDRVSCLWECYRRPHCRSFQYDDQSGQCRGSSESLRNEDAVSGTFDGGDVMTYRLCEDMVLPDMAVTQLIGSTCTTTDDCSIINSSCTDGLCTCMTGLSYNKHNSSCGAYCQKFGADFVVYPAFIGSESSTGTTMFGPQLPAPERCKDLCLLEPSFVCVVAWAEKIWEGMYQCVYGSANLETPEPNDYGVLYVRNCA